LSYCDRVIVRCIFKSLWYENTQSVFPGIIIWTMEIFNFTTRYLLICWIAVKIQITLSPVPGPKMKTIRDLQPSTRHVRSRWRFWHERKLTCTADPFIELSKAMWSAYWTSEWRDRCSKVYQCSKRDANTPWCHANDTRLWPLTCNFSCACVFIAEIPSACALCTYIILLHFADANNERPHHEFCEAKSTSVLCDQEGSSTLLYKRAIIIMINPWQKW
jgi:hypothetical protein